MVQSAESRAPTWNIHSELVQCLRLLQKLNDGVPLFVDCSNYGDGGIALLTKYQVQSSGSDSDSDSVRDHWMWLEQTT